MKKYIFLITILFLAFTNSYARSGIGGSGMVIDRETLDGGAHGAIAEGPGGYGYLGVHESFGAGGTGRIMPVSPESFDIGGFDGMRTLDLPTSFNGNIGGRF